MRSFSPDFQVVDFAFLLSSHIKYQYCTCLICRNSYLKNSYVDEKGSDNAGPSGPFLLLKKHIKEAPYMLSLHIREPPDALSQIHNR